MSTNITLKVFITNMDKIHDDYDKDNVNEDGVNNDVDKNEVE